MNLFIVEDSEAVRERLQFMLSDIPGIKVAGYAAEELDAIERINRILPDVVTVDLRLQTGSGFNVLKDIKKYHPEIRVIVLSNDDDRIFEDSCKRAGADCYFDKSFQLSRVYSALWVWSNSASETRRPGFVPEIN